MINTKTKSLTRNDGSQFGFIASGISFSKLCDCISKLPGVVFTRRRRFFFWYANIRAEFIFKENTFKIETDPWDSDFWIIPKDEAATFPEIQEIQKHVQEFGISSRGLLGNPA